MWGVRGGGRQGIPFSVIIPTCAETKAILLIHPYKKGKMKDMFKLRSLSANVGLKHLLHLLKINSVG